MNGGYVCNQEVNLTSFREGMYRHSVSIAYYVILRILQIETIYQRLRPGISFGYQAMQINRGRIE